MTENTTIIYIKNKIQNEHFEYIEKITETNIGDSTISDLPVIILDNIKNSEDFKIIQNIHNLLMKSEINFTCLILGENEFSALLLISSEYIRYKSATTDSKFISNIDDYLLKNSLNNDISSLRSEINDILTSKNYFNVDCIFEILEKGDIIPVHFAYVYGFVDYLLLFGNKHLEDKNELNNLALLIGYQASLYVKRMENINNYFYMTIRKLTI
jgi:hypothetical protein